jgi:hypothetical protein
MMHRRRLFFFTHNVGNRNRAFDFCVYINYNDKSCDVPIFAQMMPIPMASLSHMGDALYI